MEHRTEELEPSDSTANLLQPPQLKNIPVHFEGETSNGQPFELAFEIHWSR